MLTRAPRPLVASSVWAATVAFTSETSAGSTPQSLRWCAPTSDQAGGAFRSYVHRLGTSTDSSWILIRAALDSLPAVTPQQISVIRDEDLCQRASRAMDTTFFVSPESTTVHLARIGNRFAIHPVGITGSGWGYVVITDTAFRKLAVGAY